MGNHAPQDRELNQYDYLALTHFYLASLALVFVAAVSLVFYRDPWGIPVHGDIAWKFAIVLAISVWFAGHICEANRCRKQASCQREFEDTNV
ncbi:MAG: hypothetical protein H6797_04475 [Candidatus Nomurabacteria bacterium]|nr:MAG: hypothetical protein H6797_04475 [Candidatus Nomurabacteria bacterium]